MTTKIIVCLDGCAPEYLAASRTPNLDAIAARGFKTIGRAVVPTVTNVNNTSIVTAGFPAYHGITSNYFLDPASGREFYMESSEYLLAETVFRRAGRMGLRSAVLTAKDKLKTLICDGAEVAECAENPSQWLVGRLGPPPGVFTIEVNHWLFRAAREVLREHKPDMLYLTTTDYVTHTYAPEDEKALWNLNRLDELLGEILNIPSDFEIIITADHGMNAKTRALDLNRILHERGIGANAIPIIKDRYVVHHRNMGGAAYVYLDRPEEVNDVVSLLRDEPGIEAVMLSGEAARLYNLHPDRIGNIFVLADRDSVFGSLPAPREEVKIRSHGSLHEREIPIIGCGKGPEFFRPESNPEIARWIIEQ